MNRELHEATALVETVRAALRNAAALGDLLPADEAATLETVLAVALEKLGHLIDAGVCDATDSCGQ